jgi:amino acid transporter
MATQESYGVHSEVGQLRKVMVCAPGRAHMRLTPSNCDALLFDDVLWVDVAKRDHFDFITKMRDRGVEVVEMHNLLAQTVAIPEARKWILDQQVVPNQVGLGLVDEIRSFLEGLSDANSWVIGVGLLLIFGVVNLLGIKVYGAFEVVLTIVMWATLAFFGLLGIVQAARVDLEGAFGVSLVGTDLVAVLSMVGLAMFLFVGVEYVTPLAAELRDPAKVIPKAMFIGLVGVAFAMFVYGLGVLRQVENVELAPDLLLFDTPLPIPAFGEATLGTVGRWWLAVAVLFAGGATINTFVAGIPRILYGMAKDTAFPPIFAYLHPRFKSPVVGIAVVVAIPAVYAIVIQGDIDSIFVLILAAVMAWLFSYILVNISIIMLRRRRPDLNRPYRTPMYPVPQILASIGMLVTMWYIAPPFLSRADIYLRFFVMLAVVALFAVWQTIFMTKKRLFEPVEPEEFVREELGTT